MDANDITLTVLRRKDPDVEQILGMTSHVTMYVMSVDAQKWERGNVEGTLLVLKRRTNPRFQLMVLNKLNTDNYSETIESGFHAEIQKPYLIYTQGGGKVQALWFYEEADLDKVAALLLKVEAGLPKPPTPPAAPLQGDDVSEPESNTDDGAFWDKPVKAKPAGGAQGDGHVLEAPVAAGRLQAPAAAADSKAQALNKLFNKMQIQAQQQASGHGAALEATAAAATPTSSNVALPPSFFQQAAPPPPQSPVPAPLPAHAPPAQAARGAQPAPSALDKLFNKQSPAAAAPPPAAEPAAPPAAAKPHNALASLFDKAAKAGPKQPGHNAQPTPFAAHAQNAATARRPAGDEKVRLALSRLVQREEFIALLCEELRAAGLDL